MSDRRLRSDLIRLAAANPAVKAAVLPLLKKTAEIDDFYDKRLLKLVSSAANSTRNGMAADARDYIDQALRLLKEEAEFLTFPDLGHVRAQLEFAHEGLMGLDPRRTAQRPLYELKTSLDLHQRSRTAGKIVPVKGPMHIGDSKGTLCGIPAAKAVKKNLPAVSRLDAGRMFAPPSWCPKCLKTAEAEGVKVNKR